MKSSLAFASLLVVWGNVASLMLGTSAWLPGGSWSFVIAGSALVLVSLAFARVWSLDASAMGLRGDPLRGALVGAALGGTAALAGVAALRLLGPVIVGRPIDYAPLSSVTDAGLAQHIAFFLPLGDIVPEEIAFRGVLLGALARSTGTRAAILGAGATFALWHLAVVVVTIGDTTLGRPSPWFLPAVGGALAVVVVGGVLLAWLRLRTGSLATTVMAHWAFNAVVLVGLWSARPPLPSGCC